MSASTLRKAAVLLTSLPQEEAAQIMSKLTSKQVEQVSIEIAKLGSIMGDEQESVINEFADVRPANCPVAPGVWNWPNRSSKRPSAKTPAARSTMCGNRLNLSPSGSYIKLIAKTC